MAFITQYEVDRDRQNKMNQGLDMAVAGFEENRKRALEQSRKGFDRDLKFAEYGVTPTSEEKKELDQTGYSENLIKRLSVPIKEKKDREEIISRLKNQKLIYDSEQLSKPIRERDDYIKSIDTAQAQAGIREKMQIDAEARRKQNERPAQNEFAAAGFSKRARMAEEELAKLPVDVGTGPLTGLTSYLPEAMVPERLKLAQQAQNNFISAVLRKESGAAISAQEYENERIKYFPQPGDTTAVIEQKKRAREQAVLNLEAEGERALPRINNAANPDNTQVSSPITQKIQGMTPGQKQQRLLELRQKRGA